MSKQAAASVEHITIKPEVFNLKEKHFKQADVARTRWHACIEHGVAFDEVLKPEFWSHVARQFKIADTIEVISQDQRFYAELYVLNCDGSNWAKVALVHFVDLTEQDKKSVVKAEEFEIMWNGANGGFSVVRISDREKLATNCKTKEEAQIWLRDYQKALNK